MPAIIPPTQNPEDAGALEVLNQTVRAGWSALSIFAYRATGPVPTPAALDGRGCESRRHADRRWWAAVANACRASCSGGKQLARVRARTVVRME